VGQRRNFFSALGGLALGLIGLMTAAPAQAASTTVTVNCTGSSLSLTSNNFSAGPTDTINITNNASGSLTATLNGVTTTSSGSWLQNAMRTFTVVSASGGSISLSSGSGTCAGQTIVLAFVAGGGGGGGKYQFRSSTNI